MSSVTYQGIKTEISVETDKPGFKDAEAGMKGVEKSVDNVGKAMERVSAISAKLEGNLKMSKANSAFKKIRDMFAFRDDEGSVTPPDWDKLIPQLSSSAIKGVGTTLSTIAKNATTAGRALAGFGKEIASRLIGNVTAAYKRLTQLGAAFKRIMLYRAIRSLIKEIGQAFREGANNLYQWSLINDGQFASSMDRLATEAQHVKNSLGAVLAPVLNAMIPLIERVAHAFITAVNAVNQFIAAISGAGSWTKALHTPVKYAEAAGSGLANATKKAKEFKATILSFDEINKLNDNTDNDNGSGGGAGAGIDYGSMFETQTLDDYWKDLLKKTDWSDLGKSLAKKFNSALTAVDNWINTKFKPESKKWANRLATLLNGAIEETNWNLLGKTLGDGLNALIDAKNTFLEKFKSGEFGRGIGKAVRSWFDTVDWDGVGRYFANKLNLVINIVDGFFQELSIDATKRGEQLGTMFASWVSNINWDGVTNAVRNTIKTFADILWGFLDYTEGSWDEFSGHVSDLFAAIFENPDTTRLINGIGEFVNRLVDLIGQQDWYAVGARIADALASIDWWDLLTTVVGAIGEAFIGGIGELFATDNGRAFLGTVAAVSLIGGAFNLAKTGLDIAISNFTTNLGNMLVAQLGAGGLGATVLGAMGWIAGIGALIAEVWTIIDMGVQYNQVKTDEILAKQREASSIANLQAALAAKGITASIDQVNQWLDGQISTLELTGGKFKSVAEIAGQTTSTMADTVSTNMGTIANATSDSLGSIGTSTADFSTDVNNAVSTLLQNAANGSTENMNEVATGMVEIFNNVSLSIQKINTSLADSFNTMASSISTSMSKMYTDVSTNMQKIATSVQTQASRINAAFRSVSSGTISTSVNVPQHANGGIVEDGLFMANHGELVGGFTNGRTAVANNDMIIEGIEQGVYNAVLNAMSNQSNDGGDIVFMIDSEEIARASMKGQRKLDRRYNTTVRFTG